MLSNWFGRNVYCLLGLPLDMVDMADAVHQVRSAAAQRTPCFITTPNLNFLIACRADTQFRNSVIDSDLSLVDGMPLVWMARLLGIPIRERVAGSDMFEQLKTGSPNRISVYFFGGIDGVAEMACRRINEEKLGIECVGFEYPGFLSIQEMSSEESIGKINASGADFLVVSLGARKGQAWIEKNRARISVPVISHLGAVINFVAGRVDRAPAIISRSGLEWLWRIKEEPGLWLRYISDGFGLLRLMFTRVLPYAWFMFRHKPEVQEMNGATIELLDEGGEIIIRLRGTWVKENLMPLRKAFYSIESASKNVRVELEHVSYVDSAFIGLLLLLYGDRKRQGKEMSVCSLNKKVRQLFRYMCVEFLIEVQ